MTLFLEVHDLNGQSARAFAEARAQTRNGIDCLKYWPCEDGRSVALLVEAQDEATLRSSAAGAKEITELFAPAARWMSVETMEAGSS
jgi:hypothetical protein